MKNFDKYVASATLHPSLEIIGQTVGYIPSIHLPNPRQVHLASVIVLSVRDGTDIHNVVVALRDSGAVPSDERFSVWCSDKFLEGRLSTEEANERCQQALLRMVAFSEQTNGSAILSKGQQSLFREMMQSYHLLGQPARNCDFYSQWRRSNTLCRHTQHALATLRDTMPNFKEYLEGKSREALELFPAYYARVSPAPAVPQKEEKSVVPTVSDMVRQQLVKNTSSLVFLGLSLKNLVVTESQGSDYVVLAAFASNSAKSPVFCVRVQHFASEKDAQAARAQQPGKYLGKPLSWVQVLDSGQVITDGDTLPYVKAARDFLSYSVVP